MVKRKMDLDDNISTTGFHITTTITKEKKLSHAYDFPRVVSIRSPQSLQNKNNAREDLDGHYHISKTQMETFSSFRKPCRMPL